MCECPDSNCHRKIFIVLKKWLPSCISQSVMKNKINQKKTRESDKFVLPIDFECQIVAAIKKITFVSVLNGTVLFSLIAFTKNTLTPNVSIQDDFSARGRRTNYFTADRKSMVEPKQLPNRFGYSRLGCLSTAMDHHERGMLDVSCGGANATIYGDTTSTAATKYIEAEPTWFGRRAGRSTNGSRTRWRRANGGHRQ